MDKGIEKIIANYFDEKISDSETKKLIAWIEKGNIDVFNEYVILNFSIEQLKVSNSNKMDLSWESIASKINDKKSIQVIPLYKRNIFKYAAAILIFVSVGYFFLTKNSTTEDNTPIIVNNNIEIGTDKATLTLNDGSTVTLEKGKNYIANNITSNGEEIIYKTPTSSKQEIAYNYLTIPRGGQYHVKLSDGTEVWLNSESQLKYPTSFIDGEERKIELIYGEAYFIVSPSTEHKGSNFSVKSGIQEIEVLGTQFNIKAYNDENLIYTTLVEGKVSVDNTNSLEILRPNQQYVLNIASNEIQINTIDVSSEIAWVHGDFIFNKKPLKDIMKVLSRWYDVEVKFENKALEDTKFYGELSRHQNIEDILTLIKTTNTINTFEINNNKILIK